MIGPFFGLFPLPSIRRGRPLSQAETWLNQVIAAVIPSDFTLSLISIQPNETGTHLEAIPLHDEGSAKQSRQFSDILLKGTSLVDGLAIKHEEALYAVLRRRRAPEHVDEAHGDETSWFGFPFDEGNDARSFSLYGYFHHNKRRATRHVKFLLAHHHPLADAWLEELILTAYKEGSSEVRIKHHPTQGIIDGLAAMCCNDERDAVRIYPLRHVMHRQLENAIFLRSERCQTARRFEVKAPDGVSIQVAIQDPEQPGNPNRRLTVHYPRPKTNVAKEHQNDCEGCPCCC